MCLDVVEKKGLDLSGYGWKVFGKMKSNRLRGEFHGKIMPINKWIHKFAPSDNKNMRAITDYRVGFHVFRTRKDARIWITRLFLSRRALFSIRKVKFRQGHTMGKIFYNGERLNAIVADEIKVERA